MTPDEYFAALRRELIGRQVTDRQLAGNSLSIWVATRPQGKQGWTIWLEPSWHVASATKVVAGSMQAQDEADVTGWQAVTDAIDTLLDRVIESLAIDEVSGDLRVDLSGGYVVRTFASDPRETFHWRIRELATDACVVGGPAGLHIPNSKQEL